MKRKSICFCGPMLEKLPKGEKLELMLEILNLEIGKVVDEGYHKFMVGSCYGFDLMASEILQQYRKYYNPEIEITTIVAFREQWFGWSADDIAICKKIVSKSDCIRVLSDEKRSDSYIKRNEFMIDQSKKLICFSNGKGNEGKAVEYASKMGCRGAHWASA